MPTAVKSLLRHLSTSRYGPRRFAVRYLPAPVKRLLLQAIDLGYVARAYGKDFAGRGGRLPDFLIVGAQRSGTTYLYDLLVQHPSVNAASHKEIHYFDLHYRRGAGWYRGNFSAARRDSRGSRFVCGEATPTYISYGSAPTRVRQLIPEAKLIVLLREPVARSVSHYHHFCRLGYEDRSFEDAISWEYSYLSSGNPPLLLDSPQRASDPLYLSLSAYAPQLEGWLSTFPPEQLFITASDEFFVSRDAYLARLRLFLELESPFAPPTVPPKQFPYPEVGEDVRRRLAALFEPYNRELESLLGRPLEWSESATRGPG